MHFFSSRDALRVLVSVPMLRPLPRQIGWRKMRPYAQPPCPVKLGMSGAEIL